MSSPLPPIPFACGFVYSVSSWIRAEHHYFSYEDMENGDEGQNSITEFMKSKCNNISKIQCSKKSLLISRLVKNPCAQQGDCNHNKLLLALCSGDICLTQFILEPILQGKPKLSTKLLRKPPFRFILDIIKKVFKTYLRPCELPSFMDSLNLNAKSMTNDEKAIFLTQCIDYIDNDLLGNDRDVSDNSGDSDLLKKKISPKRILAGVHPDHTNTMLQLLGVLIPIKYDNIVKVNKNQINGKQSSLSVISPPPSPYHINLMKNQDKIIVGNSHIHHEQLNNVIRNNNVNDIIVDEDNSENMNTSNIDLKTNEINNIDDTVTTTATTRDTITDGPEEHTSSLTSTSVMSENELFLLDALACFDKRMLNLENNNDDDDDDDDDDIEGKVKNITTDVALSIRLNTFPSITSSSSGYVAKMRESVKPMKRVKNSDRFREKTPKSPPPSSSSSSSSMSLSNKRQPTNNQLSIIDVGNGINNKNNDDEFGSNDMDCFGEINEIPDVLWAMAGLEHVNIERNSIFEQNTLIRRNVPTLPQSSTSSSSSSTFHNKKEKKNKLMILKYDDNDDKTKQVKTSKTVEKKLNKKQASSNSSTLCLLSDNSENTYSLVVHENNNKSNASKKSCDEIIQKRKNNQGQYNKHNSMDHFPRKNKSSTIVQDKDNDEDDDDDDEDKEWEEWERSWTKLKKWLHQKKVQRKKMKNDYKYGKAYKSHNIKQKFNQSNNNNNNDNVNHEDEKNQILFSDRLQLFMIKLSKYKTRSNIDHDNIDNLISFEDIPWPEDHESILCISNSDSKLEKKKKLRMGLIFWHPDHFKSILNQIHKVRVQYKQSRMFNNNNNNNNDNSNNIKSLNASLQEDAHGQNDDDELMHLYMEKAHEVTRRIIIEKKKEFS